MARQVTALFFYSSANKQIVVTSLVGENYSSQFDTLIVFLQFLDPVSVVEGIMVDMGRLRCAIEKELSKVARRETRSLLHVTDNNGNNILKSWDPSHEHKFVTKTRDQPEPGSFFPRSLWGGEMKDPGNEVGLRQHFAIWTALSAAPFD